MDTENYLIFLATPGGKTHTVAQEIVEERAKAQAARLDYLKSKGEDCINLFGSERGISALIYKPGTIPAGWRREPKLHRKYSAPDGGVFAVPDSRKRETYAALKKELASIPHLPGAEDFTNRIGSSFMIIGRHMCMCWFETIGESLIVHVPHISRKEDAEENSVIMGKEIRQFAPPDCTPLKRSEYFRLKEEQEAQKEQKEQPAPSPA